ncbi:unnamed protein product [Meloidogyne enterolobii]|uniref:Uncharacterized protein n=1 Tax=Meloidogyne enterolobii TaxID=390850 RepID=A0ACB0Y8U5_MELEN
MPQLLKISIIFVLPVFLNFVTSGSSVLRPKRGSEQYSWITESESTESDEEMTPSTISTDDFVFVGDMVFEKKNIEDEDSEEEGVQKSVIKDKSMIWPNKQMPIHFHSSVGRRARKAVQTAINILADATCISFPKYDPNLHKNYMTIKSSENGCWTFVGFKDTQEHNQINLASGVALCESSPAAIHEIMHSLGVYHEQNRYDRDEYIEVLFDNLMPNVVSQYQKQSKATLETYGEPYDYGSIMHYQVRAGTKNGLPVHAGSKNGQPAFRVLRQYDEAYIGNARIPSLIDLSKLNKLYGCPQPEEGDSSSGEINDPRPQKRPPPHHVHDDDCTCEDS